mgnify:CR=1 FL=1|tara:strand:- start:2985 stop:4835 length:1851 start_codon:yes stop_codon:yes gene_type:complete
MKDNIITINLETSTAPVVTETRGKDWIEYGDANGDWRNLYPQFLIDLYYSSSITAAIVNSTAEMIAGENLIIEDEDDRELEARVKLQNFMDRANGNESLHEVLKKVAFDFKLQGAFALNIVWSKDRTQIAEVYHIDVSKLRCARPDELGKTNGYYISSDWSNTRQNKPYYVPAFNTNDRTSPNQIMYAGLYSPNMNSYYTSDWLACANWALCDGKISEYHLQNVKNSFSGSFLISFANGIPTFEERMKIEQSITEKFTGTNSGKFILTFSDDKTRTPEISPISPSDLDKQYLALQELLTQNILSGHRVTSPMLMGIKSDTGLGNNADELNSAGNFYLNTVVKPFQDMIVKQLRKIFQVNQMDMPVNFVQLKPITLEFTSEDLKAVMTEAEIRSELGLEPLDVEVREDFSKVEKTELDAFIEEFGEDINEDWELIEEEVVDGEHQDFDFEETLNEIAGEKIELASTGRAIPSRKSEQDGISKKSYDYFRVRYVYSNDNFLTNKSGTRRKFCQQMMGANKLYRKEDIINMGKKSVNPGFGIDGANKYSIWLYKGGPQCFHFWSRRIFKTVIGESKTTKIEDADAIGYTKAKSEGFTAKKNDKLVATPPRKMKNNGYYN